MLLLRSWGEGFKSVIAEEKHAKNFEESQIGGREEFDYGRCANIVLAKLKNCRTAVAGSRLISLAMTLESFSK